MLQILKWSRPYFTKHRWNLLLYVTGLFIVTITSIITPYLSGAFVDSLIGAKDLSFIWKYVTAFIVICLLDVTIGYVVERLYCVLQMKTSHAISTGAIHHVQSVTPCYIQGKDAAFVNQQIDNDANMVSMFCLNVPVNAVVNFITIILPLIFVFRLHFLLGISMIVLNCVYFVIYILLKKPMYNASYALNEEQSAYFSRLNEQLSNIKFIQTHGIGDRFILRVEASLDRMLEKLLKHQKIRHGFSSADGTLKAIANIIVFAVGGAAVVRRIISIGEFTILLSYFAMSIGATQYFFTLGENIQENKVSCDRLQEIFDVKVQTMGSETIDGIDTVTCSNLTFSYDDSELLRDVTLRLEKGHIYAFTGENGAGKSTLINLLLGIYIDEYEGSIEYNDVSISNLNMQKIRSQYIGVSEQEPMLLPETLRFNLSLDDQKNIDKSEFMKLCSMLNLDSFLMSLPDGLDTIISEKSSNLSGGEKQKISIIRALLKKPSLLVLDEPTSALDKTSRKAFCKFLGEIKDNTIIMISTHDKELLEICDQILHIEKGKVHHL